MSVRIIYDLSPADMTFQVCLFPTGHDHSFTNNQQNWALKNKVLRNNVTCITILWCRKFALPPVVYIYLIAFSKGLLISGFLLFFSFF